MTAQAICSVIEGYEGFASATIFHAIGNCDRESAQFFCREGNMKFPEVFFYISIIITQRGVTRAR